MKLPLDLSSGDLGREIGQKDRVSKRGPSLTRKGFKTSACGHLSPKLRASRKGCTPDLPTKIIPTKIA